MLGIGLNVRTARVPGGAGATPPRRWRSPATRAASRRCSRRCSRASTRGWPSRWPSVLEAWRARDALPASRCAGTAATGTAAGIDDDGALLVDTDAGQVALDAGEVHLRR